MLKFELRADKAPLEVGDVGGSPGYWMPHLIPPKRRAVRIVKTFDGFAIGRANP